MTPAELARIGRGFGNLALDSQAAFRSALDALAQPGRPVAVSSDHIEVPDGAHGASAALLLALLDADTALWLSPALQSGSAQQWLRFHTGCRLTTDPAQARFAWVAAGDSAPPLACFAQGTDDYPDQSTTCVFDVRGFAEPPVGETGWQLRGPGISSSASLRIDGLDSATFMAQWAANHSAFPRGVDLFFATGGQVVGLPRSTRIDPNLTPAEALPCT